MNSNHLKPYLDWFGQYVQTHINTAEDNAALMERKQRHTMRVLEHVRNIAAESGASEELQKTMEIAALLHDVGRFLQLVESKTCDFKFGNDHGETGAKLLAEADILNALSTEMRAIVLSTVQFHNNTTVPPNLTPEAQLVLAVVRDADKLDAIRNNLKYQKPDATYGKAKKCGIEWHDTEASPEVLELAMSRQLIPMHTIQWSNDFILFLCCWIYDMGFPYTFTFLKESGLYAELLSKLPDNERFTALKTQLWDDLNWIGTRSKS